ncbi:MAG TPA: hypothetical protein VHH35_11970 [Pyrinomonadaceae bacterium]|nr:hypothetical protein [Pyrinomonadaceae bacterium]
MKRLLLAGLLISLFTVSVFTQKQSTLFGDAWIGVVESANETTREITMVNPNKKTETFTGVLKEGYHVKLKDGASRELKVSELKPGLRIRVFYKSKTQDIAGQRKKVGLIHRIDFLGRDEYTRLREMLKVQPSIPVSTATAAFPTTDPLKLYLALEPEGLDQGMAKWADRWNKEQAAKHGRIDIVDDLKQADVALVVIFGKDESYLSTIALAPDKAGLRSINLTTVYLIGKDDKGLRILSQRHGFSDGRHTDAAAQDLGKVIENRLKDRSK